MLSSKCDSKKINYPFNCYSGGRHLNAISHSKNLNMLEKHFMLTIGSLIDFRDFENSAYYISARKLSELMSCTERTILNLVRSLNDKKYIIVENRFDENKRQMSNLYALSPLIFEEYATLWSEQRSGGRVNDVHTVTPLEELPQEQNTISSKEDIVQKETDPSGSIPHQNSNSKVKSKVPRKKKFDRPPVTQSHQKVGRIFIPDSRYVKKTYYDKTAMFFLIDEFLTKHGEAGHKAIDELYKLCKSTNECGRREFDLGDIEDALEASIEKFIITIG